MLSIVETVKTLSIPVVSNIVSTTETVKMQDHQNIYFELSIVGDMHARTHARKTPLFLGTYRTIGKTAQDFITYPIVVS